MVEARDLKYLIRSQTRGAKIGAWILAAVACVLSVGGILNIGLAARLAAIQGIGFEELFSRWLQGVQLDAQYSGLFLFALNRLQMGMLGFVYGLGIAVIFCAYNKSRQRNKRILKFIEDHSQEPA